MNDPADVVRRIGEGSTGSRLDACAAAAGAVTGDVVHRLTSIHAGQSRHKVFRVESARRMIVLKVYGDTGHAARERELHGNAFMAAQGCPVPEVLWTSVPLNATAFAEAAGRDANAALDVLDPQQIGYEIGHALALYTRFPGLAYARDKRPASARFSDCCLRYVKDRCAEYHGIDVLHRMVDNLDGWSDRLTPSWFSGVSFDCKLEHFFFDGDQLSALIDLEHWDRFDPAVDVGDLLHDVQQMVPDVAARLRFITGLVVGLDSLYPAIAPRLPFYVARRYLVTRNASGLMSGELVAAAQFWLAQRFPRDVSPTGLTAMVAAAPNVGAHVRGARR